MSKLHLVTLGYSTGVTGKTMKTLGNMIDLALVTLVTLKHTHLLIGCRIMLYKMKLYSFVCKKKGVCEKRVNGVTSVTNPQICVIGPVFAIFWLQAWCNPGVTWCNEV